MKLCFEAHITSHNIKFFRRNVNVSTECFNTIAPIYPIRVFGVVQHSALPKRCRGHGHWTLDMNIAAISYNIIYYLFHNLYP